MRLSEKLRYTTGYKYRTHEAFWVFTNYRPAVELTLGRITLTREGLLFVSAGYSSDGPSGPTLDTPDFMPGATGFHDPIYELLRNGVMDNAQILILQPLEPRLGIEAGVYSIENEEAVRLLNGKSSHEDLRREADRFLIDILLLQGMPTIRTKWIYWGLKIGGRSSASTLRTKHTAPNTRRSK